MIFKIWTNKVDDHAGFTEGRIRDHSSLIKLKVTSGRSLGKLWPKVIVDVTSKYEPADSFISGPLLIVSKRLAEAISGIVSKEDVEFLALDVVFKNKVYGDYYFLNVLNVFDALDRRNAIFTEIDNVIDCIDRVSINESAAYERPIFQLDSIEWLIVVNDAVVECIEKGNFTGVVLRSQSEWRPF